MLQMFRWGWLALGIAALMACGGRTELRAPGRHLGVGGAGAAGGMGSGGLGAGMGGAGMGGAGGGGVGGGGAPPLLDCPVLRPDGPVRTVAGSTFFNVRQPKLMFTSSDHQQVTLLTEWMGTQNPGPDAPSEVRHTTFEAWGAWPTSALGPSFLADLDGGGSFAGTPQDGGGFAVMMSDLGQLGPPNGVYAKYGFTPGQGSVPAPAYPVHSASDIVHDLDGGWYLSQQRGQDAQRTFLGFAALEGGMMVSSPATLRSCSDRLTPNGARIARVADSRWLAAVAFGSPGDNCTAQAPTALQLMELTRGAGTTFGVTGSVTSSPVTGEVIDLVDVEPRSDGAWVMWTYEKTSAQSTVQLIRIDGTKPIEASAVSLSSPGGSIQPGSAGLASHGDDALVAIALTDSRSPGIAVRRVNADGDASSSVPLVIGNAAVGRIAILGDPQENLILVAWAEPVASGRTVARVARFRCED